MTVNNVPPSATFVAPTLVEEGSIYTLSLDSSSDPSDADTAAGFQYHFKCDSEPYTPLASAAEAECTAGNNGAYLLTGTIRDVGPGLFTDRVSTYSRNITVVNVAPVIDDIANTAVAEGSPLTIPGSFTDPGAETWTATADFGDGTGSQALALSDQTFTLGHTYGAFGTYVAVVTVENADTGADSESFTVTVGNISPDTTINPLAAITEGGLIGDSGQLVDPGDNTWTATVNYGDATPSSALALNPDKTFNLGHVYADNGSYDVIVRVNDNGGVFGCD